MLGEAIVLYIGTHKIVLLEGTLSDSQARINHHVVKVNPAGFARGLVVHMEKATATIHELFDFIYSRTNRTETPVFVVLGNAGLKTYHFSSSQYYRENLKTITPQEIQSVVRQTRSVATLPLSEHILQTVPESFLVNDMPGIRNPVGLEANRLGVQLKIFTMQYDDFKNIDKAFEAADIEPEEYFPKTLVVSEGILTEQEKNEGVLVIDIADDVTQLAIWKNGYLGSSKAIETGSRYLTEKIAAEWQISLLDAAKVKEKYATLESSGEFADELIPLVERNGKENHQVHRGEFQGILRQHCKSWLSRLLNEAQEFARQEKVLYPHYVFTGGGVSLGGFLEFLQNEFSRDARIGLTHRIEAPNELMSDPALTPALGMFHWLSLNYKEHQHFAEPAGLVGKTVNRFKNWFSDYF